MSKGLGCRVYGGSGCLCRVVGNPMPDLKRSGASRRLRL